MNYKKIITTILLSTTVLTVSFPLSVYASENTKVQTNLTSIKESQLSKDVLSLFKDGLHKKLVSYSCSFQVKINNLIEKVKVLPKSKEKLELSDLLYLANNLYFEGRGALSLRQRANRINKMINDYFVDNKHDSLKANFDKLYYYHDGNYGGLYDVVLRYQKLGLPYNTPSILKDFGKIEHAYKLYKDGKILINIPDKNFQKAINHNLGLSKNNSKFERRQLESIKDLNLMGYKVKNIEGINEMRNLTTLKFKYIQGIDFKLMNYSNDTALNSLKTLIVKNMPDWGVSYVGNLPNLKTFEADGGNISDPCDIIANVPNVKIYNQKVIAPKIKLNNLGLKVSLWGIRLDSNNLGYKNYIFRLEKNEYRISNNGKLETEDQKYLDLNGNSYSEKINSGYAIWKKSDLEKLKNKQVSVAWNTDKYSGKYIIPFE